MEKYLQAAQKLYDEGKWQESNVLLDNYLLEQGEKLNPEEIAEVHRLKGWDWYYIGTKGLKDKRTSLQASVKDFLVALDRTSESKTRISALNGLPLSLWILEEKDKAWQTSDHAVKEFPDEPSVWNTRAILCRWAKKFEESVKVCEKVYITALERVDYRTAGHGKHNKADALVELGFTNKARAEYEAAIGLYMDFEKATGQSVKVRIEAAQSKLLKIIKAKRLKER